MPAGGLVTVGAISAVAGLYGAHQQASAATKAAKTQAASGDKAIALQTSMYNTAQSNLAPYRAIGSAATNKLSSMMGLGSLTSPTDTSGYAMPRPDTPATYAGQPTRPGGGTQQSSLTASAAGPTSLAPTGLVQMVSPDGKETGYVPQALVSHFIAKGARAL